jgi:hypothetical protein
MTLELGRGYLITYHFNKFLQCNEKLSISKVGKTLPDHLDAIGDEYVAVLMEDDFVTSVHPPTRMFRNHYQG